MRVLVTADIHNGYSGRLDDTIWSMRAMSEYARENNIDRVIVLGDLFHNRDHLTINVLNAVHDFLKEVHNDQEWILFPGNHDMFMKTSWKINSVRPLDQYATVCSEIGEFALDGRKFIILPFMHFEDKYMSSLRYLENRYGEEDILLTHIGVNNALNNSCFLLKHWSSVTFQDSKFNLILSGHFHNHQIVDDKVCYPGSPLPFKFDEGMVPHGFLDVDTDSLLVNFVDLREIRDDCPMDFVTIVDETMQTLSQDEIKRLCENNRVRVHLSREYNKEELNSLRDNLSDNGASQVSWMKKGDSDEPVSESVSFDADRPIFNQWLEQKKTAMDTDLLISLHVQIAEEAEERYTSSNEVEAET